MELRFATHSVNCMTHLSYGRMDWMQFKPLTVIQTRNMSKQICKYRGWKFKSNTWKWNMSFMAVQIEEYFLFFYLENFECFDFSLKSLEDQTIGRNSKYSLMFASVFSVLLRSFTFWLKGKLIQVFTRKLNCIKILHKVKDYLDPRLKHYVICCLISVSSLTRSVMNSNKFTIYIWNRKQYLHMVLHIICSKYLH